MTARDRPHDAADAPMRGVGEYRVICFPEPPSRNGCFRHTDPETGVPEWGSCAVEWIFTYPSEPVEE